MKPFIIIFLLTPLLIPLPGISQDSFNVCTELNSLVDKLIPENFPDLSYRESGIEEVEGEKVYRKLDYSFLGTDSTYFDPDGQANKKFRAYPLVGSDKEAAAKLYLQIIKAFDNCDLVYTSFAGTPNPNVGMLATQTIGIDRRFFNSTISLYQYQSSDSSRYWIEYELIAPK